MFKRRNSAQRRIFFPWESRGGLLRFLSLGRVGSVVLLSIIVTFAMWVGARERQAAGERKTLQGLYALRAAVERYLVENEGSCPPDLASLEPLLRAQEVPRDGWGRPFRLVCPSDREGYDYVLMSDGPDGKPGGTDRIEY